jgi:hypothetical protein
MTRWLAAVVDRLLKPRRQLTEDGVVAVLGCQPIAVWALDEHPGSGSTSRTGTE